MARKLTDLAQLTKSLIHPQPTGPKPVAQPAQPTPKTSLTRDEAEVLAYFSKDDGGGTSATVRAVRKTPTAKTDDKVTELENLKARVAELEALLQQSEHACRHAQDQAERAERDLLATQTNLRLAEEDRKQLRATCAELEQSLSQATQPSPLESVPAAHESSEDTKEATPSSEILRLPEGLHEVFPGELREMILSSLAENLASAQQAGRDRRAAILAALLQANPSTGELERRRTILRQVLKDAGSFNDAHVLAELAKLGIQPVSGRKHWKLDYGGFRLTMAKTPSDYRSHLNAATEMVNRCY